MKQIDWGAGGGGGGGGRGGFRVGGMKDKPSENGLQNVNMANC